MFCSPQSELTKACASIGLSTQRINLNLGYDLYKPETYAVLWDLFQKQRPKKIWVSTMCTLCCNWVDLNYSHRPEDLQKNRCRERRMFKLLCDFLLRAVELEPETKIYWEWPQSCRAWKERVIETFFHSLSQTFDCRIDGCHFGLRSESGGFVRQAWKIKTNDIEFYSSFRLRVCHGNHQHEWIHGLETNKSAYYPPCM